MLKNKIFYFKKEKYANLIERKTISGKYQMFVHKYFPFRNINKLFTLVVIIGVLGCGTQKDKHDYFSKELKYKNMIKQKDALLMDNEIEENIPEMTAEDYGRLGDNYNNQNDIGKAFINYTKALRLDPGLIDTRYKLGLLFIRRGMIQEALNEFEEILKKDPENALAYEGKGMVFLSFGKPDESKENFEKAIIYDDKLWSAHAYLGIIYDHQGLHEGAIKEFRKAIAIKPDSSSLMNNLGMSYYLSGKYEKSLKFLKTASELNSKNRKIYNNLGLVLHKLGKYEEALMAFKQGSDEAGAYNNIGYLYMNELKYDKALDAFNKAIEIKPNYFEKAQENREIAQAATTMLKDNFNQEKSDADNE